MVRHKDDDNGVNIHTTVLNHTIWDEGNSIFAMKDELRYCIHIFSSLRMCPSMCWIRMIFYVLAYLEEQDHKKCTSPPHPTPNIICQGTAFLFWRERRIISLLLLPQKAQTPSEVRKSTHKTII